MRTLRPCFLLVALALLATPARADLFDFYTKSTATQTITSPLVSGGMIDLHSAGTQHYSIDTTLGTAGVTSDFQGSDFQTPSGTFNYDLYNTATTGTVTDIGGLFTVKFLLLFELKIVGGPLDGVTFETKSNAIFQSTVSSLPFPTMTAFGDPARPQDAVAIFLKADPNGVLRSLGVPVGAPVGSSSNRVVTTLGTVPEPASAGMLGLGVAALLAVGRHRRSRPA